MVELVVKDKVVLDLYQFSMLKQGHRLRVGKGMSIENSRGEVLNS